MLVLDTNAIRSDGRRIADSRRYGDARPMVSPVVVQELLHQVIEGRSAGAARAALDLVGRGDFGVLPEPEERIRSCFGLGPVLPMEHRQAWAELARDAAAGLIGSGLRDRWNALHHENRIGCSYLSFSEAKASKDFMEEMRDLPQRQRRLVKAYHEVNAANAGLSRRDKVHGEGLLHLILTVRSQMLRQWLLVQLAYLVDVPGVKDALSERPVDHKDVFSRLIEPHYRGGLELLLGLMEARWLPWVLQAQGVQLPEQNDYFDMMLIASVPEPDGTLVTKEHRWVTAAGHAGVAHRVVDPTEILAPSAPRPIGPGPFTAQDLLKLQSDPLFRALPQGRLMQHGSIGEWLRLALMDAAEIYGASDSSSWWPTEQGQATTVSWALVMRIAREIPGIQAGPLTLGVPWGQKKHIKEKRAILRKLWPTDGKEYRHSPHEVQVDFTVTCYDAPGNPLWFACESEVHAWHGTGATMGMKSKVTPGRHDDYTWDFYKLLLVPAPYRLFIARVGAQGLHSETERLDQLQAALGEVMRWYGHGVVGDAELTAVLLPESAAAGRSGTRVGCWQRDAWHWSLDTSSGGARRGPR